MTSQYGKYKEIEYVKEGFFTKTYLVLNEDDQNHYLLKTISDSGWEHEIKSEVLLKEIDIILDLSKEPKNNFIPKIFDYDKKYLINPKYNTYVPYYVTDILPNRNLFFYLERENYNISEKHAKFLFKQIVKGIQFCHNRNVCHLDINPGSFIFDKEFNLVLCDFSFAERIKNEKNEINTFKKNIGLREYECPEIWTKKGYKGVEADVFSLGAVLFKLVTGKNGFSSSKASNEYYSLIMNNNKESEESYWNQIKTNITNKEFSNEFKQLYLKMIAAKASERPSIEEILNSEWLKEINNLNKEKEKKLESEVKDYLKKINDEIKTENEEVKIPLEIDIFNEVVRSYIKSMIEEPISGETKVPKLSPENEINTFINNNMNFYLILWLNALPHNFMNILIQKMKKENSNNNFDFTDIYDDKKETMQFTVFFEEPDDEFNEEEQNEMEDEEESYRNLRYIKVEIFDCDEDIEGFSKYLLSFKKFRGNFPIYYYCFKKKKKIIKELSVEELKENH